VTRADIAVLLLFATLAALAFSVLRGTVGGTGDRPRSTIGPGAMGTIHDLMHQDKRRAVEIVVKGEAARIDGERGEDDGPPEPPPWARLDGPPDQGPWGG
jgi:hypothetical protein